MGDAPGDVGPGGGALSSDEIADVVERDDRRAIVARGIAGDPNVENALAAVPQDCRLPLVEAQPQRTRPLPDRRDAVLDRIQGLADQAVLAAQQALGGGV